MKIVKNTKYAVLCAFVFLCEMIFGKYIEIANTIPMLSFSLCMAISVLEEKSDYIIAVSAILGILLDVFTGHGFGTFAIGFTLASYVSFLVRGSIFSSKILILICNTIVLTLGVCTLYYLFHILDINSGFFDMLSGTALPVALYNAVCSLVFYAVYNLIFKRR